MITGCALTISCLQLHPPTSAVQPAQSPSKKPRRVHRSRRDAKARKLTYLLRAAEASDAAKAEVIRDLQAKAKKAVDLTSVGQQLRATENVLKAHREASLRVQSELREQLITEQLRNDTLTTSLGAAQAILAEHKIPFVSQRWSV